MRNGDAGLKRATFAGRCFWCTGAEFEKRAGVASAVSGDTGGHVENPDYKQVCLGKTQYLEVVEVRYDPVKVK